MVPANCCEGEAMGSNVDPFLLATEAAREARFSIAP
jgi:hypothetical protein